MLIPVYNSILNLELEGVIVIDIGKIRRQRTFVFIIRCIFSIGREPTMWLANNWHNCLQTMVYSGVTPSKRVLLHSRPQNPRPLSNTGSPRFTDFPSNLANLISWEYETNTLRILRKIAHGQSSQSVPQARKIVGSGDENGFAAKNILRMRNWNHILQRKIADGFPELPDRMIKQLLNYRDLSVSRRSRYFAQPRPIIVNYSFFLRTIRLWNKLPAEITESNSVSAFSFKLLPYLAKNQ